MSSPPEEPIAVIGSACRFAGGATSPSKLWDMLMAPRDLQQVIPSDRFDPNGFYHRDNSYHGHSNVRHAYLLDSDLAAFDAEFFGVKPIEANAMDPQQRLLLEVTYEALETAGLPLARLRGSDTGVYVGVMFNDYATLQLRDLQALPTYFATGTGQSVLANRVSHFYDWRGPSVTLDTACSSSLVAVHFAKQALRSGESRVALVCGANLIVGPEGFIVESKLNMLSPDGRSRMWDQGANGYARGEGVAALVLKTVSAAIEDGDHIECVIRETGMNQDGATPGITMPSASAQELLIRSTYQRAGLHLSRPNDWPQYFEAHGTGTPAGDPAEAEAIFRSFTGSCNEDDNSGTNHHPSSTEQEVEEAAEFSVPHLLYPPLYTGSIKTVFGHTEGTAGVAALMKASLALQHGIMPPNLHFDELSDRVKPFYRGIEVVSTVAKKWPALEPGQCRRASVNSFGFGGTNAHAILESWSTSRQTDPDPENTLCGNDNSFRLFLFSASSQKSLREMLYRYANLLTTRKGGSGIMNAQDLAFTLRERRSTLLYRIALPATTMEDLCSRILSMLEASEEQKRSIGVKVLTAAASSFTSYRKGDESRGREGALGIFTGQGAQYARMGAELIECSARARQIMEMLDSHLAALPDETQRPSWSLTTLLLTGAEDSQVGKAEISQPLCTAVQIMLVDLLAECSGFSFAAVIGHSSGEIAAAYAAGYLAARDAMWIAHYRGVYASAAQSPNGPDIKGAMVAVGSSMQDMQELCDDEAFAGRLAVAASNSPLSVTVAGDEDAVAELEDILEDEEKFHRRLKVDKAYHSNHMRPCYAPYVEALRKLGIEVRRPQERTHSCHWFSSVNVSGQPVSPDDAEMMQRLGATYWADNFTNPVLFSQAVTAALKYESHTLAIEIGPHPALRSPVEETVRHILEEHALPYHGTLRRGKNAMESTYSTIGFLWERLGEGFIDLSRFERSMYDEIATDPSEKQYQPSKRKPRIIKDLPTYPWNHEARHWHESRVSRKIRQQAGPVHILLGHSTPDSSRHHMQWRHLLRLDEMEWLRGHAVHDQPVFPAAGYLVTALEAAVLLTSEVAETTARMVELQNFSIHQALPFDVQDTGIEVLINLADVSLNNQELKAKFTYLAAIDASSNNLVLAASADITVTLGEPSASLLPQRPPMLPHMIDVEPERFYSALSELGYNFSGRFRALSSLQRRRGRARCLVELTAAESPEERSLLIHPAEMDAILQAAFLAYSYPYDEELQTLHLPTSINRIRINPAALREAAVSQDNRQLFASVDSFIEFESWGEKASNTILGNINLYMPETRAADNIEPSASVQVQGVAFVPLGGPSGSEMNRPLYSKEQWVPLQPDGAAAARGLWEDEETRNKARLLERIATFYLRKFDRELAADHPARSIANTDTTGWYLNYAHHVSRMVEDRRHTWWEPQWDLDTDQSIEVAARPYSDLADFEIMLLVGAQMPHVFAGETTMLEQFRAGGRDVLDRYYAEGTITKTLAHWIARAMRQLVDRNPHMHILEVGAGTGGATLAIMDEIGDDFLSYTYTDISAGFFEGASNVFADKKRKMVFKTLDIETDPLEQGFTAGTYDIIVAFFVVHATTDLVQSLRNLHKLLKPGGYLVMGEGADDGTSGTATSGFIFGTLPGWWAGAASGRELTPLISAQQWDGLLRTAGFSGADATTLHSEKDVFSVFPVVSQALDSRVRFLRDPLPTAISTTEASSLTHIQRLNVTTSIIKRLVILGGQSSRGADLVDGIRNILLSSGMVSNICHFDSLLGITDFTLIDQETVVVSLCDLDSPVFEAITPERFLALKSVLQASRTLLWITSGRRYENPWANMMTAFLRCAAHEFTDLCHQQIDVEDLESFSPAVLAKAVIRFHAALDFIEPARRTQHSEGLTSSSQNLSWIIEPEIVISRDGLPLIPRLRFVAELNQRYMAGRAAVSRQVNVGFDNNKISNEPVVRLLLQQISSPRKDMTIRPPEYVLREVARYETELWEHAHAKCDWICLRTTSSVLSLIRTSSFSMYLIEGIEISTATRYLALTPTLTSAVRVLRRHTTPCNPHELDDSKQKLLLQNVAAHMVALAVVRRDYTGRTIVAYNVPPTIALAMSIQAMINDVRLIVTKDYMDSEDSEKSNYHGLAEGTVLVKLPPYLSRSDIDDTLALTSPPASFVSYPTDADMRSGNEALLADIFGSNGAVITPLRSILPQAFGVAMGDLSNRRHETNEAQDTLRIALSYASHYHPFATSKSGESADVLPLSQVLGGSLLNLEDNPLRIIDWISDSASGALPVRVSRLDYGPMFKGKEGSGSTYWLVGMSGALGISLADWMINKGARNLVMTSRRPDLAHKWIEAHKRSHGATVTVLPCDVADETALRETYRHICNTLPPISGVIHGAMVLRDVGIANMTFDQLTDVVRPKVQGSQNLDRLFGDVDLDFFVLTSSINTVIGNRGQANYAAANAFMCGLAAQRRQRGLRAAAVNGGAIIGAGYMERDARRTWDRIAQNNYMMRMSEDDFVQSVCEGIEACRLDEGSHGPELSTGLNFVPVDAKNPPFWAADPKFLSFITHSCDEMVDEGGRDSKATGGGLISVRDALRGCQTKDEVFESVKHSFATALRGILQMSMSDNDIMDSRSVELGLDSLVSVNIRSWFLNNLGVKIPALAIMGGNSMKSLVRQSVEALPSELVPLLNKGASLQDEEDINGAEAHVESSKSRLILEDQGVRQVTVSAPHARSTASAIDDSLVDDSADNRNSNGITSQEVSIDWYVEASPSPFLMNVPFAADLPLVCSPPRTVVLTGVGGLYGRHLLQHLLKEDSVNKVICIAIRGLAARLERGDLPLPGPHIEYHEGDLSAPLLGLPPATADSVFSHAVDAVVHCGGDTSHMKPYHSIKASNVGSTVELARLCLPRRVPFHYVSSAGLAMLYRQPNSGGDDSNGAHASSDRTAATAVKGFPPVCVTGPNCAKPAPDGSFGYAAAKWTCEALLERIHASYRSTLGDQSVPADSNISAPDSMANGSSEHSHIAIANGGPEHNSADQGSKAKAKAEHEWPVYIHRPSTIIRSGRDAVGEAAERDWVNALLTHAHRCHSVPEIRHNRGALDLVSVQTACVDLVSCVMAPATAKDKLEVCYVHQVGDRVIPLDRLREIALHGEEDMGANLEEEKSPEGLYDILPMEEWIARALANGLHPAVAALIEMLDEPMAADYPRLLKRAPSS